MSHGFEVGITDTDEWKDALDVWLDKLHRKLDEHFRAAVGARDATLTVEIERGEWTRERLHEWAQSEAETFVASESSAPAGAEP